MPNLNEKDDCFALRLASRFHFHCIRAPSLVLVIWVGFGLAAGLPAALGQSGITQEEGYTVFRADTNQSLLTFEAPLSVPAYNFAPTLRFDFGFGSAEPDAAQQFFDSFSVTAQSQNQPTNALLLTADRTGIAWAPPNPGGFNFNASEIVRTETNSPTLTSAMPLRFAYSIIFRLPEILTGGAIKLFFDFFNNQNSFSSIAFIRGVEVTSLVTNSPPLKISVQSSAAPNGPFAEEATATLDPSNRTVAIPRLGATRFFRIRSDIGASLFPLVIGTQEIAARYQFQPLLLILQSAEGPGQPFIDEPSARFNLDGQTVSVTNASPPRIYRVVSDGPVQIDNELVTGEQRIINFSFQPRLLLLQSSASAAGPFADESGVSNEPLARTLRWPRLGQARFFRLVSTVPLRVIRSEIDAERILFHYEQE